MVILILSITEQVNINNWQQVTMVILVLAIDEHVNIDIVNK